MTDHPARQTPQLAGTGPADARAWSMTDHPARQTPQLAGTGPADARAWGLLDQHPRGGAGIAARDG